MMYPRAHSLGIGQGLRANRRNSNSSAHDKMHEAPSVDIQRHGHIAGHHDSSERRHSGKRRFQ